jgi:ABC-type nitrate/sulfonate/bicarbonate transport system substrate-binding protein
MGLRLISLAAVLVALSLPPANAQPITKVVFGQVSPTATGWPGMIATRKGFFAANGVEMDIVSIGVSEGMRAVSAGSLDVMHNSSNAIISFLEAGGTNTKMTVATVATHPGVLVGRKGMTSASELKGKVIGTSSIKSGSTILLRRLLKARGLNDNDYDLVAGQGSVQVFQGLQAGALDAIWLVPPQSIVAAKAGYSMLGTFREVAPKFYFVCFAANTNWLKAKTKVAQGFAKAWLQGVAWLYDPANRAEAEKILAEELKIASDIAASTYDELVINTKGAYPADGKVDFDVLKSVIDIMVEGGELAEFPKGDLHKYVDETMLGGK